MLLGLILFPLFFNLCLHIWELSTRSAQVEARANHEIGRTAIFYASLAFILILIIPLWMQFVQDFPVHPLIWYMPSFIIFIMPLFVLIILYDKNSPNQRLLSTPHYFFYHCYEEKNNLFVDIVDD